MAYLRNRLKISMKNQAYCKVFGSAINLSLSVRHDEQSSSRFSYSNQRGVGFHETQMKSLLVT